MTWFRVDDGFPEHRKVVEVGGDAAWLHVCAMAYCSRNLSDGFIPKDALKRLSDRKSPAQLAARLVACELWDETNGGWQIHDYLGYQRARSKVEDDRAKARERMSNIRRTSPNVRSNKQRSSPNVTPTTDRDTYRDTDTSTYISDDDDSVDTPDQSSSFDSIIATTAKAIALKDRDNPPSGYVNGIAKNLRTERTEEVNACIHAGLTLYDSALRLGADPWFAAKALNGSHP